VPGSIQIQDIILLISLSSTTVSQIIDGFDLPTELDRLMLSTKNLNSLAKSINIERAIKSEKGPYRDVREAVEKIKTSHACMF
jgi:hypothetical protein